MTTKQRVKASFRDPSGFLFKDHGVLYRQVNQIYQETYDHLMKSGLYNALVEKRLLIHHTENDNRALEPSLAYKVIRPESISFVSYPYEWSFSQLKDAAITTLEIQKLALKFGMSLKDSSAYNIQFQSGRPLLIDTLSFELYQEGMPWVAYRQFCQHFLSPLALMAYCDVRLSQLFRIYIDGIPLDMASKLLPWRSRFNLALLMHIHIHASAQQRYADKAIDKSTITRQISQTQMFGLLDNLETGIRRLTWQPKGTDWADYYETAHHYSSESLESKRQLVGEYIDRVQPGIVWDLGANVGLFSRLASQRGIQTLAFDIDPAAVERNYLDCVAAKETNLLPLILDLTNPPSGIGWANQERNSLLDRSSADLTIALALIHHIAISNNVPMSMIASLFCKLSPWLIIEFVPKDDSQVKLLLSSREDIFPDYTVDGFEFAFSEWYDIHRIEVIKGSQRRLYLMERR